MQRILLLFFILLFTKLTFAGTVDTVSIYSNAMRKSYRCVVIMPDSYKNKTNKYATVYLLHGFSGRYDNWIKKVPQLKKYADDYQLLLVCPDGAYSSWYYDSPVDTTFKFETYIATEVPAYIEAHYNTIRDRKARAITGL